MKRIVERFTNYLLLTGTLLFGVGILAAIVDQALRSGVPIEFTLVMTGLILIIMGLVMAKIFGDVLKWKI